MNGGEIVTRAMYARRTHELNALTGWKATLSTCMEIGDVVAPLFTGLADKLSRLISWLLVALIGRGLGLVYRGVRQSMGGGKRDLGARGEAKRGSAVRDDARSDVGEVNDDAIFFGFTV